MNFVVFGQARTGSTLLVRLLQSHQQVQCDGEILGNHIWNRGKRSYFKWVVRRVPHPYIFWKACRHATPVYGFKLLFNQVASPARVLGSLSRSDWLVIHIQRRNLFDLTLSRNVATVTKRFGDYKDDAYASSTRLTISPQQFIHFLRQVVTLRHRELDALQGIPHLRVTYEDDLLAETDRNRSCNAIFESLQIEPLPVSTAKTRSWNRPYSELITNYAELRAVLQTPAGEELQQTWDQFWADT